MGSPIKSLLNSFKSGSQTIGTWFGISKGTSGGVLNSVGFPKDPTALPSTGDIPNPDNSASAYLERDKVRRRAALAGGRDSTIRTSAQGAPYSATPKSLLGQ